MNIKDVSLTPFTDQKPGTCVIPSLLPHENVGKLEITFEQLRSKEKGRRLPKASLQ